MGTSYTGFPDPDAASPEDWNNPYALPPRPLNSGTPPADIPGASGFGGFQPGQDTSWGDWWRTPLDSAAFNPQLSSSGATGTGDTAQPQASTGTGGMGQAAKVMAPPPVPASVSAAPAPSPQGPPTMPQAMPPPGQASSATPQSTTQQAIDRDTALLAQPAPTPGNHWYQRLGMAIIAGTKLAPYADQILHGQYTQQMGARQAAEKELQGLSTAQEAQQRGQYYEGLESGRQEERQITAQGRQDVADTQAAQREADRQQKAFNTLVQGHAPIYRPVGQPAPQGWETVPIPNPIVGPGYTAYLPSQLATVPKELLPYMPGYREGDQVDRDTLGAAAKAYQTQIEKQNTAKPTPEAKEVSNPAQVLLNPGNYDPATVATAQHLFAQEHRDPNATAGVPQLPPRNPTLAPGTRDEGVLANMDPSTQAVIKQLVDYKYPLPSGMALSKPYWQTILGAAAQYDPSFDASQYAVRQKAQQDFGSGKAAGNINALNQVAQHIDRLEQNWKALNNTNAMPGVLNPIENAIGKPFSADLERRLNNFGFDQQAVGDELMRVWRQVGGNENEVKQWQAKLSPNLSPAAQQGAIKEIYSLIAGRLNALKSQYETTMGRPANFHMLEPETAQRFAAHGVDPSDLAPGARYGSSQTQPAPPQYVRTSTGPNGHKIGQTADGAWHDIQTGQKLQ
jgi:hypothetical protein